LIAARRRLLAVVEQVSIVREIVKVYRTHGPQESTTDRSNGLRGIIWNAERIPNDSSRSVNENRTLRR
jgi:hypothetical protein